MNNTMFEDRLDIMLSSLILTIKDLAASVSVSASLITDMKKNRVKGEGKKFWKGIREKYPEWEDFLRGKSADPPPQPIGKRTDITLRDIAGGQNPPPAKPDRMEENLLAQRIALDALYSVMGMVKESVDGLKTEVATMNEKIAALTADMQKVKETLPGIQTDMSSMGERISDIHADLGTVKERFPAIQAEMMTMNDKLIELEGVKQDMDRTAEACIEQIHIFEARMLKRVENQ